LWYDKYQVVVIILEVREVFSEKQLCLDFTDGQTEVKKGDVIVLM
jgi:hypothetical protein